MEETKAEQSGKKKVVDRKPKYISNLLKQAEIRNQEEERRKERKVQKEREEEGDEFADKEKFVTSAYRKKMEEMQKLDEEEKKKEAMEQMLDVTKQKDMSGFYRHLFRYCSLQVYKFICYCLKVHFTDLSKDSIKEIYIIL